jgi:hypothetical protein
MRPRSEDPGLRPWVVPWRSGAVAHQFLLSAAARNLSLLTLGQLSEVMLMRPCDVLGGCAGLLPEGSLVRPSCVRYVPTWGDRRETLFSREKLLPEVQTDDQLRMRL